MLPIKPLLATAALVLATSAHAATATNATELRDLLRANAQPAALQTIPLDSGCGPTGCVIDIEALRVQRDSGTLQRTDGQPLHWHQAPNLPDIDWASPAAYQVNTAGQRWGTCLEFSHSGIGKSGVYQRWSSVVVVPYENGKPGADAYRLVGYWTGCDSLQAGDKPGDVKLPIVSQGDGLEVVRYRCDVRGCVAGSPTVPVGGSAGSETGELQLP